MDHTRFEAITAILLLPVRNIETAASMRRAVEGPGVDVDRSQPGADIDSSAYRMAGAGAR